MAKQLDILSVQIQGDNPIDVEFQEQISVKQSHFKDLVKVLQSFTQLNPIEGATSTTFSLLLDHEEQITIVHDYSASTISVSTVSEGDKDLGWLKQELESTAELQPKLLNLLNSTIDYEQVKQHLLHIPNPEQGVGVPEALSKQSEEMAGEKGKQYLELTAQIKDLQSQIDLQKQADEAQLALGDIQVGIDDIDKSMESVQSLLNKQVKLKQDVERYQEMLPAEQVQKGGGLKQEAIKERSRLMVEESKSTGFVSPKKLNGGTNFVTDLAVWIKKNLYLLILLTTLTLSGLILGVLLSSPLLIIIGVLGGATELVILILLNTIPSKPLLPKGHDMKAELETDRQTIAEEVERLRTWLTGLEKFFIDHAWLGALQSEMLEVERLVSTKMGDADFDNLQSQKIKLKRTLATFRKTIDRQSQQELSPEEYLKKRRQMDVLKLDRSRLERELRSDEGNLKKLKELGFEVEKLIVKDYTNLTKAAIEELAGFSQISRLELNAEGVVITKSGDDPEIEFSQLDEATQRLIFTWLEFSSWESWPILPLLFFYTDVLVQGMFPSQIHDKIEQLSAIGQVVKINVIA